jgi:hypothetical protein
MDAARQHLEADIARADTTAKMLDHLADVVHHGPSKSQGATYQEDAGDALMHGAELARESSVNLRHVARIYDELVARPVPDPRASDAREVAEDACGPDR